MGGKYLIWLAVLLLAGLANRAVAQPDPFQSAAPPEVRTPRRAPTGAPAGRPAPPAADTLAAPGRPGWIVDSANGCWLWDSNPLPGETVRWSGACPRGPAGGAGVVEWRYQENGQPRVDQFSGTLRVGRAEGRGTATLANGNRYEGEYRDGRRNGRGTLVEANGNRYEGEWRDDRQNGRGTFTAVDGERYEGEWRDDRRNGRGTLTWTAGRYEGEWRDDRPHGFGRAWYQGQDGWYEGNWISGCLRSADGRVGRIGRSPAECR